MSGEWIKEATTLGLVTELINSKQTFSEVSGSTWYRHPWQWWNKKRRLAELSENGRVIAHEISKRFEGILLQMFQRAKAPKSMVQVDWEECQTAIWQLARDNTRNMTDYHRFCAVLWNISLSEIGSVATYVALRPKFMLRQFVDEMPSSDERGTLRATAFGRAGTLSDRETLDSLERAFPILHQQLLSRGKELKSLTDGEITWEKIRDFEEPFAEYRHWLFEC